jgi:hypothetical protein
MSTSKRRALASLTTRCRKPSESARQTLTLTPYFLSKAATKAEISSVGIDE